MILYNPVNGDPLSNSLEYRPRTCFLMTQLAEPMPPEVSEARGEIEAALTKCQVRMIDALSLITGRDFLEKIWRMIASVPLAVGVVHSKMPPRTQNNIYYELGLAHALGKETVMIKFPRARMPSDFVRTEYVVAGPGLSERFAKFMLNFFERATYYETMAGHLESSNPLLSIDYLRRAYLISGDVGLHRKASDIFDKAGLRFQSGNTVEAALLNFGPLTKKGRTSSPPLNQPDSAVAASGVPGPQ